MTGVGILSPGFPHAAGGVTDLTARLVRHWTDLGHPVSVASDVRENTDRLVTRWHAGGIQAVLLHYVPFLYGRRGLSRYPERLSRALRQRGIRVTVEVHEPWVPLTRLPWLILSPLQRRQLRRLLAVADAATTPVPAWQQLFSAPPSLVYVGSTLGEPGTATVAAGDLENPVVFSPFAAGLRWDWIATAVRAIGAPRGLTIIGGDEGGARARADIAPWIAPGWDWRGRLPAGDIIQLLSRARLVLAPFIDGITGRRTSICAALGPCWRPWRPVSRWSRRARAGSPKWPATRPSWSAGAKWARTSPPCAGWPATRPGARSSSPRGASARRASAGWKRHGERRSCIGVFFDGEAGSGKREAH